MFIVQRATLPKNGLERRQKSICAVRYILATPYNFGPTFLTGGDKIPTQMHTHTQIHTQTHIDTYSHIDTYPHI